MLTASPSTTADASTPATGIAMKRTDDTVGASRRYDGPMGKSDRAFVFGALGLVVSLGWTMPSWTAGLMPVLALLIALTTVRRVRSALAERAVPSSPSTTKGRS